MSLEDIKKCHYDTTFYDYFSQESQNNKQRRLHYFTVHLDRYQCGDKGTFTLKSYTERADPYDNNLGRIIDVNLSRQQILDEIKEHAYDSITKSTYDSMIKQTATSKNAGYYRLMRNVFRQ